MKAINTIAYLWAFMLLAWSCSDDQGPQPSSVSGLQAQAREGAIRLKWDIPADSNFLFVRVQYINPRNGEQVTKNASIYTDTLLVDGLLARDGEYHFEVTTVGADGQTGAEKLTAACTALPVQPVETKFSEKIELSEENLSSNCADPDEGILANLVDGGKDNLFHSNWHSDVPFPQWIEIHLPEPVESFEYKTWNTQGRSRQNPEEVKIMGSTDGQNWDELFHTETELPSDGGAKYESGVIVCSQPYSYLRYVVIKAYGNPWFNMAEFEWNKVWFDIYDPENE